MPIFKSSLQYVNSTKDQYSDYIKKCHEFVRKGQRNRKMNNKRDTLS